MKKYYIVFIILILLGVVLASIGISQYQENVYARDFSGRVYLYQPDKEREEYGEKQTSIEYRTIICYPDKIVLLSTLPLEPDIGPYIECKNPVYDRKNCVIKADGLDSPIIKVTKQDLKYKGNDYLFVPLQVDKITLKDQ